MKARWIVIPIVLGIGGGTALTSGIPAIEVPVNEPQKDQRLAPEALAKKSGCFECHSIDKVVVGPAYRDVAERYKGQPEARAALIETVKKGGKGHWTAVTHDVPMPPHGKRLSAGDISLLVDWVLNLNNSENK
jgi:cytochrome c